MNVNEVLGKNGLLSKKLPTYTERPSQIELSDEIMECYTDGTILLANAPTGIGKSIAGLVPAILNAKKYKTVISTATKALQSQYYEKDLPFLSEMFNHSFTYAMMKGRGNYICLNRFESFEKEKSFSLDYELKEQYLSVKNWLNNTKLGDLEEMDITLSPIIKNDINSDSDDCAGKDCPYKILGKCFYGNNKVNASKANILLVNTDLLCTDLVARSRNGRVLPDYDSLIIDEAHHLENTMSKYLGGRISNNSIKSLIGLVMKYLKELNKVASKEFSAELELVSEQIDNLSVRCKKCSSDFFDNFYFETDEDCLRLVSDDVDTMTKLSCNKLKKVLTNIGTKLPDAENYTSNSKVINLYGSSVSRIERLIESLDDVLDLGDEDKSDNKVYWVSYNSKGEAVIEHCPIDISDIMNEWLFDLLDVPEWDKRKELRKRGEGIEVPIRNIVLMSATLTTNNKFDFFKSRVGIYNCSSSGRIQTKEVIMDNVFDYKHQALLYIPKGMVEPTGNKSVAETFTLQLSQHILEVAKVSDGRMLCLFTSYAEMERIYEIIKDAMLPYNIYHQNMMPKSELIKVFTEDVHSILLATSSFWEGASFEGETVSVVVMDRIPFPVPSEPIIEARIDKLKELGVDWFNNYYLPMASVQLQQGFGRLIRTKYDYGVVMLADKRIITKGYGWKFLNSLPETYQTNNIRKVERWFELVDQKREIINRKQKIKDRNITKAIKQFSDDLGKVLRDSDKELF